MKIKLIENKMEFSDIVAGIRSGQRYEPKLVHSFLMKAIQDDQLALVKVILKFLTTDGKKYLTREVLQKSLELAIDNEHADIVKYLLRIGVEDRKSIYDEKEEMLEEILSSQDIVDVLQEISEERRNLAILRKNVRDAIKRTSNQRIRLAYQKYGLEFLHAVSDAIDANGVVNQDLMRNKYVGRKTYNMVKRLVKQVQG